MDTATWDARRGRPPSLAVADSDRTLVFAFGSPDLLDHPEPIVRLVDAYPTSVVVGCSSVGTVGAATSAASPADGTLDLAVLRLERGSTAAVSRFVPSRADSHRVGLTLAADLRARSDDLVAVFVLGDGLGVDGEALADGLAQGTGGEVPVSGGLAGDGDRFSRTWVLAGGAPRSGWVTALGLAGAGVRVGHGASGGWQSFGPDHRVTCVAGTEVVELDGRPALTVYREDLGADAAALPAVAYHFPLAVSAPGGTLVRTVIGVDERRRSLTLGASVAVGSRVRLLWSTADQLLSGAGDAVRAARLGGVAPTLALAVSCVGRRRVLDHRAGEEAGLATSVLGPRAAVVGFYSYGGILPAGAGPGRAWLHNQTLTVTTLSEVPPALSPPRTAADRDRRPERVPLLSAG